MGQGHNLNNFGRTPIHNATYLVSIHQSIGSGEEDFLRFLPYMGMAAMLVMWPRPFEQFFLPKGPGGCIWNLVAIGPVVSEEESFEIVDGRRMMDGRTTEPAYTISFPGAFGSGELKMWEASAKLEYLKKFLTHKFVKLELLQTNGLSMAALFSLWDKTGVNFYYLHKNT